MHAIADETDRVLSAEGSRRLGREGYDSGSPWLLLDYGDVVLHIFMPETRDIYDLEHLWADAKRVDYDRDSKK
jgi:ribosome-associated protein